MSIGEGQKEYVREFKLTAFQAFAEQLLTESVANGQVERDARVRYRAYAWTSRPTSDAHVRAKVRRAALPLVPGRLDELMPRATSVGPLDDNDYPIFIDQHVLPQSVDASWKGVELEGGAWLIGNLHRQEEPPEIFAHIHTVLAARGVTSERDRLDLSHATYLDLQTQLERRRVRMGKVRELPLGFVHSHPFLPAELDGHADCRQCEQQQACSSTSAFLSARDAQFHAAVFGAAPYAAQMVWASLLVATSTCGCSVSTPSAFASGPTTS